MPKRKSSKAKRDKRGRKPHIDLTDMDHFYSLINQIQTLKEITYIRFTDKELPFMIENILRDAGLEFSKKSTKGIFVYRIKPTFSVPSISEIAIEMMEDEIIEEGQLF